MGQLVDYAKDELNRAGLFDKDSDYDGMIGPAVLEIIDVFSKQGHSGFSAGLVTSIVEKLMRFEPLTPLTYEPDEWNDVSKESGTPMWQNKRKSTTFSVDGGKTHYDLDDAPDRVAGALDHELSQQDYNITKQAIIEQSKRLSLEWRIEQMRRIRTFMAKADYENVMNELEALREA